MIPFVLRLNHIFHNCINYIIFSSVLLHVQLKPDSLPYHSRAGITVEMKADQEYAWSALMFYLFYPIAKKHPLVIKENVTNETSPLTHLSSKKM